MKKAIAIVLASTLLLGTTSSFANAGSRHHRGHGHGNGAAFAGAFLGGVFLSHALSNRHPAPQPAPAYNNCHPSSSVGFLNGYRAEFVGTMCYDPYGNGYIVPQSQRFVRYLP